VQYYYGDKMLLRVLDETDFWKLQESEHTVVIQKTVLGLEEEYIRQLQDWEQALSRTHAAAIRYIEAVIRSGSSISPQLRQEIIQFINFCICQSQEFINLLNLIATNSVAIRGNPVAITVVNHIRRESEYFIGIAIVALQREEHK